MNKKHLIVFAIKHGAKYSLQQIKAAIDFTNDETVRLELLKCLFARKFAYGFFLLSGLVIFGYVLAYLSN